MDHTGEIPGQPADSVFADRRVAIRCSGAEEAAIVRGNSTPQSEEAWELRVVEHSGANGRKIVED